MSDHIEHEGKKYFEESYLIQANISIKRLRSERDELLKDLVRFKLITIAADNAVRIYFGSGNELEAMQTLRDSLERK